jgi:hypothetical protein
VVPRGGQRNDWHDRAVYVNGRYRWIRRSKYYRCGETPVNSAFEYSIRVTQVKFVGGQWIGSRFSGVLVAKSLESGGCINLASERYIVRGTLLSE